MNSQSNAESFGASQVHPTVMQPTRPFYWCVRRELWENRSIYIAPLAVAAVTLFGYLIASIGYALSLTDLARQRAALGEPFHFAMALIMGTAFIVSIFYSLEALHGERRDRSILFWKSLPVSDLTTVLSKAAIPLFVLPLLAFAITVGTQFIMLLLSTFVLHSRGMSAATLWTQSALLPLWMGLLYHLVTVHILWYAPLYAWLLLISAWARRATFLWAALPPAAICILEKLAFNSSHFANFLQDRIAGGPDASTMPGNPSLDPMMTYLSPGRLLSSPGLWLGLIVAAAFLATAVRLRHYRAPI